jgi:hypothetical protein
LVTDRTFVNPRQPQTLYISQILLYITAVGAVLFRSVGEGWVEALPLRYLVVFLMTVGAGAGAYGIANARRWGYLLGIAAAIAPFIIRLEIIRRLDIVEMLRWNPIGLLFDVAIIAALLHPESRAYQKQWFE